MPAPPFSIGSVKNKFRVPGTPTSTPTYTKIAIAPKMKWRNFKAPDINLPLGSVEVAGLGSGMGTIKRTKTVSYTHLRREGVHPGDDSDTLIVVVGGFAGSGYLFG